VLALNTLTLDGLSLPWVEPNSVSELQEIVRQGKPLYPVGGGTLLSMGHPPTLEGSAVSLRSLNRVIDYPARDMTITVQAGITIQNLQATLRTEKQWLPIDIPFPEKATLGGSIAGNISGSRRFGHGTLRDYVIGISIVNDRGEEAKAGGRVVKNVAGYDLMKLFTGSLGTLGIISQVTLKVKPLPGDSKLVLIPTPSKELPRLLELLRVTKTRPVCVDLLNPAARAKQFKEATKFSDDEAWLLVVGFEDNRESVLWQVQTFREELPEETRYRAKTRDGAEGEAIWKSLADFPLSGNSDVTFKVNLLSEKTLDYTLWLNQRNSSIEIQTHLMNGIVRGHLPQWAPRADCEKLLQEMLQESQKSLGNLMLFRCPTEWKATSPIWGASSPDRGMMKKIKQELDPKRMFNPGRFVDGI
jgi:glycolate oxidase FAD binding subunit